MASRSIRWRLVAAALLTIAGAMTAAGWTLTRMFAQHVERRVVAELEIDLKELIAGLTIGEDGTVTLNRRPSDQRYHQVLSGDYWLVELANQIVDRSRSLWDETLRLPPPTPNLSELTLTGPEGLELMALVRDLRVERAAGKLDIRFAVAMARSEVVDAVKRFRDEIARMLLVLGALLLAAFATAIALGLAPLAGLRRDLAKLRTGEARRLEQNYPQEVARLVDDLNLLLDERDRDAERKRQRAADLAHGLKTPMTAISNIADEIGDRGEKDLARELRDYTSSMLKHVERELALARSVHAGPSTPPASLKPILASLVRSLERLPRGEHLAWVLDVPDTISIRADPTALTEIFGNVLDNARKWAKRGIHVSARQDADAVHVVVRDDGPGVDAGHLAELTDRGRRLDRSKPGSGLGLAIVSDLVEELGGHLTLACQRDGGLEVTVSLPTHAGNRSLV